MALRNPSGPTPCGPSLPGPRGHRAAARRGGREPGHGPSRRAPRPRRRLPPEPKSQAYRAIDVPVPGGRRAGGSCSHSKRQAGVELRFNRTASPGRRAGRVQFKLPPSDSPGGPHERENVSVTMATVIADWSGVLTIQCLSVPKTKHGHRHSFLWPGLCNCGR